MARSVALGGDPSEDEVISAAAQLMANDDPKIRFEHLIVRLGGSPERALGRVINVAAKSDYWQRYTAQVRAWFDIQRPKMVEH